MASLTVRDLDDEVKRKLRLRAAGHGRSMEAEVRHILTDAVVDDEDGGPPEFGFGTWLHEQAAKFDYLDIELPARTDLPRVVDFGE